MKNDHGIFFVHRIGDSSEFDGTGLLTCIRRDEWDYFGDHEICEDGNRHDCGIIALKSGRTILTVEDMDELAQIILGLHISDANDSIANEKGAVA